MQAHHLGGNPGRSRRRDRTARRVDMRWFRDSPPLQTILARLYSPCVRAFPTRPLSCAFRVSQNVPRSAYPGKPIGAGLEWPPVAGPGASLRADGDEHIAPNDTTAVAVRSNISTEIYSVSNVLWVQVILLSDEHPYSVLQILFIAVGIGNCTRHPECKPDIPIGRRVLCRRVRGKTRLTHNIETAWISQAIQRNEQWLRHLALYFFMQHLEQSGPFG